MPVTVDLKKPILQELKDSGKRYLQDLDALSEDAVLSSPMGGARTAADMTYECTVVNKRMADRVRGNDPGPWPFADGWAVAPEDQRTKSALIAGFSKSFDDLVAAAESVPEEEFDRGVPTSDGETPIWQLISFASLHLNYHCGQLNYIQSLHGDMAVHWTD